MLPVQGWERRVHLQGLALKTGEESLFEGEFSFHSPYVENELILHLSLLKKIKDISVVPSFIHTNILSQYLTPVLFRLSGKQRVQKYHTTDLLLKCDDIASLCDIAPLVVWSGLTALSCHRQLSLVS